MPNNHGDCVARMEAADDSTPRQSPTCRDRIAFRLLEALALPTLGAPTVRRTVRAGGTGAEQMDALFTLNGRRNNTRPSWIRSRGGNKRPRGRRRDRTADRLRRAEQGGLERTQGCRKRENSCKAWLSRPRTCELIARNLERSASPFGRRY